MTSHSDAISHLDKKFSRPPQSYIPSTAAPNPKPLPSLLPTPTSKLLIRRLTEAEMQACREKNLCYNCDEKYTRGHRCKSQFLLLIVADDEEFPDPLTDMADPLNDTPLESGIPTSTISQVQQLIQQYSALFSTPTSLPPSRQTDHAINLLPNTPPLSVCPYHAATEAFNKLKQALANAPVFDLPRFDLSFTIQTDAFGT
ncbi:hypothetical protein V8G54_037364 [Vigna mungo]|uniref:Reverse transcriptase/retrotransposon-derived protein RNase H-like domain-containing protein n=1 Tax=Vigna mungo TaxID=3915 RepID=A0AAQ3MJ40_VIGMU